MDKKELMRIKFFSVEMYLFREAAIDFLSIGVTLLCG